MYIGKNIFNKKLGFTLAEVLITLGIIGIVAEMTIPTIINNVHEIQYKVGTKKAYQVLNEATLRLNIDSDLDVSTSITLADSYAKVLNYSQMLPGKEALGGINYRYYKTNITAFDFNQSSSLLFILADGSIVSDWINWPTCSQTNNLKAPPNDCGEFFVDTNGSKSPNMIGKDVVYFWLIRKDNAYMLVPEGNEQAYGATDNRLCTNPGTSDNPGQGCTIYYILDKDLP